MCGITGAIVGQLDDETLVERMAARIRHRGPDETSQYAQGRVHLGFTRLAIMDPVGGHQPVYNEDRTVAAVVNGEIYNQAAHRDRLERDGHRFGSHSDAEVIPHLYETYGESFVPHLYGMFAVVVHDVDGGRVILARDPLGIKPLYYLETDAGFYFASEMKSLLLVPEFQPAVNRRALDQLLTFRHIPGSASLLDHVRLLPPGHRLTYRIAEGRFSVARYYTIPREPPTGGHVTLDTAAEEVRRRFDRAVERRLMSDVPIGVSLSGGLDSSAVVASVARQVDAPPKTFSVHMGEPVNELSYARMVADRYKTDHHELLVDGKEVPDLIAKVMWHLEEPVSMSEIATYAIGRAVSDHVKVLLCGDGADEVFGGYVRFQPINLCAMLPNAVLKWGYVRGMNGFTLADRRRLYSAEQREFMGPNSNGPLDEAFAENHDSLLNRLLRYELGTQLRSQLIRLDKMTMAHSVEARVPFLDTELVSYVANLPSRLKVRGFREKVLLKLAMADRLPEAVVNRRKLGWSNPVKSLFRGSFKDICREQLNASRDVVSRYFSVRGVDKLYTAVGRPSVLRIPEQKLFHLYLFIKWHEMFIEGAAPPEAVAATKAAR